MLLTRSPSEPVTPLPGDVRRIVVLRGGGVGDFVFAMPALTALRGKFPGAKIDVIGEAWLGPFLHGRPGPVDGVVAIPPSIRRGLQSGVYDPESDLSAFVDEVSREPIDIAVQIHGGGRHSNPFVRRLHARLAVGLRTDDAVELDRWVSYDYYHSEVLRDLEVVGLLGARPGEIEPRLAVTEADRAEARSALDDLEGPVVVLHPGATDPRRRWPPSSFADVGDRLVAAGAHVVIVGTTDERGLVDGVRDSMTSPARTLVGCLSLGGLAGVLESAAVVVANDSGPVHLAAAVGTSTVGIYWCGNLINAGPFTRSRHRPQLSWRLTCPVCGLDCTRDRCEHRESFVAEVPPESVASAATSLLEQADAAMQRERPEMIAARR
jgi:ADP-heptose:LPS heptosyltransferase